MSLLIEAETLDSSAQGRLATHALPEFASVSEGTSCRLKTPIRAAWEDDDEDEGDTDTSDSVDDDEGDEEVAPIPIEEEEEDDDPFDDFDEEDFDDDFDDDFEEELEDDYEIEPDDTDMFPPKIDEDDELLDLASGE